VTTTHRADVVVQIVTGSYDRVLHGISATIPAQLLQQDEDSKQTNGSEDDPKVTFTDTFLFAAHTSSIRSLALSPSTENNKRLLATGSADERINLYSLSTTPLNQKSKSSSNGKPSLISTITSENPLNRTLGSLTHHSRPISTLHFPSKSKLFSSAEDNTIAITRTRDWVVLSTIKAPIPKPVGRPSGDTLAPGEVPAGVNDFAVHPSQKLMLSVGRGERCMRLWNLMTGKKAVVLQFSRELLAQAGEGKWGRGEGMKVLWSGDGEAFVVGFERGAVVFGVDSKARAVIRAEPKGVKLHQMRFMPRADGGEVLAVSTEDGRVLFYDISGLGEEVGEKELPTLSCLAELGGQEAGITSRIKDFEVLQLPLVAAASQPLIVITANSDGGVRLWALESDAISALGKSTDGDEVAEKHPEKVGRLLGTLETGNRITCLGAFVMDGDSKKTNEAANGAAGAEEEQNLGEEVELVEPISEDEDEDDDDGEEFTGLGD